MFHRRKAVLFAVVGVLLGGFFFWTAGVHVYAVDDAGNMTRIVAFHSMSVSSVLAKANMRSLRPEDVVTPAVAAVIPQGEIAIVRARPVTLTIDHTSETIYSTVKTVGQLLADNGVKLNAADKVSPAPANPVPYNKDIVVKRTTYAYTSKTEAIAYQRVYKKNPYMEVGRSYISVMGQNGLLKKTIKVTKVAQKAVSSAVVKTQTIKPVAHEVYDVGTARLDIKPTRSYVMSATAYSNRASTILNGKDHLYGYSGLSLHYGTCAVDRRLIPMGTVLYVQGYGYAVAADTGSAIIGNRIDLFFNSYGDACHWGRQSVKVYVLPITRSQLYKKLGIT
ncbi:MAG TPA: 3D domain-containing protein [Candidatus Deferrimicrobium sp.]|nr:3D domain-containing protein [Candidatus Deferrimicrobium sp.]